MPPPARKAATAGLALALAAFPVASSDAGPPFRTDDPIPVEPGHWEIFTFSSATRSRPDFGGTLAGIDANYGAADNLQLHAAFPMAFDSPAAGATAIGPGDMEIGAKYRFLSENGAWPAVAIYPAIDFPTGNAAHGLGTGHTHVFLPLWLQKTFGKWSSFAGAGYWINPGIGNRNYWYFGWVAQYQLTDDLMLGGEVFHQTASTMPGKDQTGADLGLVYDLTDHYHLMFSVGQGLQNRQSTDTLTYYAAVQFTF